MQFVGAYYELYLKMTFWSLISVQAAFVPNSADCRWHIGVPEEHDCTSSNTDTRDSDLNSRAEVIHSFKAMPSTCESDLKITVFCLLTAGGCMSMQDFTYRNFLIE